MKVAALLVAAASGAKVSPSWEAYKEAFGKVYETPEEEAHAQACWKENVAYMQDAETDGVQQGENSFTDQCWENFAASRMTLDQGLNGICYKSIDPYTKDFDETKEMDWRSEGYVNPVKDQGSCGSCWAFSTMATAEGAYFKATGKLLSFAEQQLVSCDKGVNNGCSGGMPGEAFDYLVNTGAALESDYPYTGKDGSCNLPQTSAAFTSWRYVDSRGQGGEQKILAAVQNEGPISIVVNANQAWQSYHGGILGLSSCPSSSSINHAVVAVGYGKENDTPYWIVRNSWGPGWGESGYIRMSYGEGACSVTACFAAFISGSDGPAPPTPPSPPPSPTPSPAPTPTPTPPPAPTPPPPPMPSFCGSHFDQPSCEADDKALDGPCVYCALFNACFSKQSLPSMCTSAVEV